MIVCKALHPDVLRDKCVGFGWLRDRIRTRPAQPGLGFTEPHPLAKYGQHLREDSLLLLTNRTTT